MTPDSPVARLWRRRVTWCRWRYRILVAIVLASWGATLVRAALGLASGRPAQLLGLLPVVLLLGALTYFYRRQFQYLASPSVVPLGAGHGSDAAGIVAELAGAMNVDPARINLLVDRRRQDAVPGIARWRGQVHLVLPLGFFPLLERDRAAASAMLAHELGHVVQDDVNAGAWVAAYAHFFRFWAIPVVVSIAVLSLISTYGFLKYIRSPSSAQVLAQRLEQQRRAHEERLLIAEYGYVPRDEAFTTDPGVPGSRHAAHADAPGPRQTRPAGSTYDSPVSIAATSIGTAVLGAAMGVAIVLLGMALFRRLRRLSENAADLGAALLLGADSVRAALSHVSNAKPKDRWFSPHPSFAGRAAFIDRTFASLR